MRIDTITCPELVKAQVVRLCGGLIDALADNLVGIYLHGSLTMGCFHPERSDIDLLVVVREATELEVKREVAGWLLRCSNEPRPVEITFVTRPALGSEIGRASCR